MAIIIFEIISFALFKRSNLKQSKQFKLKFINEKNKNIVIFF